MTTASHTHPLRRPVRSAVTALVRVAPQLRPRIEKLLWRCFYEAASLGRREVAVTMNYGYAALDAAPISIVGPEDLGLELYAAVAGAADLAGKRVLEVGCGRGGGTSFVFDRFRPSSMTGLDLARSAIDRARTRYSRPGLEFVAGSAEQLPFPDASFDAIISVESTHCYDMPRFLREARRVLRPGGLLMFADLRRTVIVPADPRAPARDIHGVQDLRAQLAAAGFRTVQEEDITANVTRALELNTPRLRARIERRVPKPLRAHALEFAGVEGSANYRDFSERRLTYLRFLLEAA
jgi:SAM-dependent methyltransferase